MRPKPLFWITLIIIAGALVGFSLYRAGILGRSVGEGIISAVKFRPSGPPLEITFYSSSAKKSWVDKMVEEFNSAGHSADGHVIKVKTFHVESGTSLDQLKEGAIKPDIWSPGDESWLQLAAEYWKNTKQKELYEKFYPLVNIPLVIAMWEPMARALGYPKPIGWQDIANVAVNPKGWAAYGHPEWGRLRWGHAHPDANSGFLTIISEIYAVLGKIEGITPHDLKSQKVVSFLREFEGTVEHYGLSNSWIDDLMHKKGPGYLSCAVQYENTIIETNEKNQNKPFKLVAVYPKEGNFWTQHPAAILKEDWVTPEKHEASKKFIEFLLSKEAQTKAMQMGLRPILKELEISLPFDEEHGVIANVNMNKKFVVPDEVVLKRIRDLWEDVKVPATVVMVLDISGSMKGQPIDNAKTGAVEFVARMKPRDKLMVVIFNNVVTVLSDLCSVRVCGEQTINKIQGLFAGGGTSLHDVITKTYSDLKEMQRKEPGRRYGVLVLSDGKDTSSNISRHDFLDALPKGEEFNTPKIYTIAYGSGADKELLGEISNRTNAKLFSSSPEEIQKTYKELSANF